MKVVKKDIIMASSVQTSDFEKSLKEIHREFDEKIANGDLEKEYYAHSIKETSTYKAVIEVENLIKEFRDHLDSDPAQFKEIASTASSSIIPQLNKIKIPGTKYTILEYLTDTEKQRTCAEILFMNDDEKFATYQTLNGYLMQSLRIEFAKCEPSEMQKDEPLNIDSDLDAVCNYYQKTGKFLPRRLFYEFKDLKEFHGWQEKAKVRYRFIFGKLPERHRYELKCDLVDELEKIKSKQSKSKFKGKLVEWINEIESNYIGYLERQNYFDAYKKVLDVDFDFILQEETENGINQYYYQTTIDNWEKARKEQIKENDQLRQRERFLKGFIRQMANLMENTVETFEKAFNHPATNNLTTPFHLRRFDLN